MSELVKINPLLRARWSPRVFSNRLVSESEMRHLFEAARWSPSCSNEQPWRFVSGTRDEGKTYDRIFEILDPGNQKWANSAPVLLLLATKTNFSYKDRPNHWAEYDAGQAAAHLTFQAMEMGISVHQMAGFDRKKATELLGTGNEYLPMTVIAVGFPGESDNFPDEIKRRERSETKRRTLQELVLVWN